MPRLRLPPSVRLPLALRVVLLAALIALLATGFRQQPDAPRPARLSGEPAGAELAALLIDAAPTAIFRPAGDRPTEPEIQALEDAARRAPLVIELPPTAHRLTLTPPEMPLVDRYAAVRFVATAAPGDTVIARLLDAAGTALDSTRVPADSMGTAEGAFRVRAGVAGWTEWRVAVEGAGVVGPAALASVGAWVADAPPPRVLVAAGPPTWETRYAVRALERAGADVALVQRLGRDNVITTGADPDWADDDSLAGYDVVLLLPDAAPPGTAMARLEEWVAAGKGMLRASAAVGADNAGPDGGQTVRGDAIDWAAPTEIAPLPSADVESVVSAVAPIPAGATVAARSPADDPLLMLAPLGRGRTAELGLRESWRWAMDAGLESEHRAFWRALVDWLAAPAADSLAVHVEPPASTVGATVDVRHLGGDLEVRRPGGAIESLPTAPVAPAGPGEPADGRRLARFVAVDTGVHEVRIGGTAPAAFLAGAAADAGAAALGRARLALLAAESGGAALEEEPFAERVAVLGGAGGQGAGWLPWIFAALVILAIAEWAIRRRRGLP